MGMFVFCRFNMKCNKLNPILLKKQSDKKTQKEVDDCCAECKEYRPVAI